MPVCRQSVLSLGRLTSDGSVHAVARVDDVHDPTQVLQRRELDRHLALGSAQVDLDARLQSVAEAIDAAEKRERAQKRAKKARAKAAKKRG
jgi:hypothetical protein